MRHCQHIHNATGLYHHSILRAFCNDGLVTNILLSYVYYQIPYPSSTTVEGDFSVEESIVQPLAPKKPGEVYKIYSWQHRIEWFLLGGWECIWLLTEFFATWFSRPNSLFSFDISLATDLKPQFSVWKITFRTWELTAIFRGSRLPFPGKIGHPRISLLIIIPPVNQQKMWYPPSFVKPTTMSIDWGRPRKKRQTQVILNIIYPITSSFYPHSP